MIQGDLSFWAELEKTSTLKSFTKETFLPLFSRHLFTRICSGKRRKETKEVCQQLLLLPPFCLLMCVIQEDEDVMWRSLDDKKLCCASFFFLVPFPLYFHRHPPFISFEVTTCRSSCTFPMSLFIFSVVAGN